MNSLDSITITARLRNAIALGKMGLGKENALNVHIAANGPTLGEVIDRALALIPENTATSAEIALLKNELIVLKEKLKEEIK